MNEYYSSVSVYIWTDKRIYYFDNLEYDGYTQIDSISNFMEAPSNSPLWAILSLLIIKYYIDYEDFLSDYLEPSDSDITSLGSFINTLEVENKNQFYKIIKEYKLFEKKERILGTFLEHYSQGDESDVRYSSVFTAVDLAGVKFALVGLMQRDKVIETITKSGGEIIEKLGEHIDYIIVGEKPGSKLKIAQKLGIKEMSSCYFEDNCKASLITYLSGQPMWYDHFGLKIEGMEDRTTIILPENNDWICRANEDC